MKSNFPIKLKCKECGHEWKYKGRNYRTNCPKCRTWIKTGIRKNVSNVSIPRIRRKLNFEEIMQRDHYKAIIAITHYFDKGEGITRPQYRWALIKDHDRIEKTSTFKGRKKDFDNFFKHDRFGKKIYLRRIISSDSNFGNFLKHLVDYKILERFEDAKGVERFRLRQDALSLLKYQFLTVMIDGYFRRFGIDKLYDLIVNDLREEDRIFIREGDHIIIESDDTPLSIKIRIGELDEDKNVN